MIQKLKISLFILAGPRSIKNIGKRFFVELYKILRIYHIDKPVSWIAIPNSVVSIKEYTFLKTSRKSRFSWAWHVWHSKLLAFRYLIIALKESEFLRFIFNFFVVDLNVKFWMLNTFVNLLWKVKKWRIYGGKAEGAAILPENFRKMF